MGKSMMISVVASIVAPILAVIVAFLLSRTHEENINLRNDLQKINEKQVSISKDVDLYETKINVLEKKYAIIDSKIYSIYNNYTNNQRLTEAVDNLKKQFNLRMASIGNVMYSDRQELFGLIYRNTQEVQYISGKLDLKSGCNNFSNFKSKTRLPYDNYESLSK